MDFCTKCGLQRTGTAQFCTGCGAQFSDAADAPEPVPTDWSAHEPVPAAETTVEPVPSADDAPDSAAPQAEALAAEPTRWDTHWYKPGPSAVPQPTAAPGPVPAGQPAYGPASYAPPSHGQGGYGPGSSGPGGYGPASYAQGSPGQAPAGQGSYGQPPYQPPPHVPGTIGTSPLRRGQTAILIALLVLVLLAVGGGAYALVSRYTGHKSAAPPSGNPTRSAPATTPPSSPSASITGSPTGSATSSPTAGLKASPPPRVGVAPGVTANPAEPSIAAFLDRYFTAINTHDYAAYNSLLDSQVRSADTRSSFNTGYGTTMDSAETLTSIARTSGGDEAATVSFTSHQSPAESPTKTACTSWTITLYLQPNGSSYLIGPAPAGYLASYQAC